MSGLRQIGIVTHPTRDISAAMAEIRGWAQEAGVSIVQVSVGRAEREVASPGDMESCELVVAIGGDGTTLAAVRAAVGVDRPVLGVACGSLGALTTIAAADVAVALARFRDDDWNVLALPALQVAFEDGAGPFAINDVAVVRAGQGQVRTTARVNGVEFGRFAGDGCIVSTPIGSSAYALAAGGPLLTPGTPAFLLTPLSVHGGFCPPLVLDASAELELDITAGYGGARLEVDGQVDGERSGSVTVTLRDAVAKMVGFDGQETFLAGLRRRQIIIDSPRILAEDDRAAGH
jgi:NAD+ kinase